MPESLLAAQSTRRQRVPRVAAKAVVTLAGSSMSRSRSDSVLFVATTCIVLLAIVFLLVPSGAGHAREPSERGGSSRSERLPEPPKAEILVREIPPELSREGFLRVSVRGAGASLAGALLLRPGAEGLCASPATSLIAEADGGGSCAVRFSEVKSTGFGVVAAEWQAQYVSPERLQQFDMASDCEMVVDLLPASVLTVVCVDPNGQPVPDCSITVCRFGAPSWPPTKADSACWSLDAANGQHIAWSDDQGVARVSCLAPTQYYLRVEKLGLCATIAGSGRSIIVPPASVTVTMASIELIRASVIDGDEGYLSKLTQTNKSSLLVSSVGVLEAARRQLPSLDAEEFWAVMNLRPGQALQSERLSVVFANGSRKEVDLDYKPLSASAAVRVEPGPARPTASVRVDVVSAAGKSLPMKVRLDRLGDIGSVRNAREFDVARTVHAPCDLRLPKGVYMITALNDDCKWFSSLEFTVNEEPLEATITSDQALVPVLMRRRVPPSYLPGLWNIRYTIEGRSEIRRQCTPAEGEVTLLVPSGLLRYVVRGPGLRDYSGSCVVPVDGLPIVDVEVEWQ